MPDPFDVPEQDGHADFSDDTSTFGDRITAAREALGMTPSQLARRLGIKTETLVKWEEDRAEPRANKLQMLAGILNVSIIWVMSGVGEGPGQLSPDEEDEEIGRVLDEMREIRVAQTALSNRLARLEKRLRRRSEELA
ncbi:helix-turn-helix domain-containing protein [Algicella marina]|uniref:Helix-turn-helix domain-containing protein n=1 Tax=Algicella marina TaxID=2683284 RepID=A0A6P1T0W9_9RHOB|nr:helix-turn-helix domain-containing protein [Algicella marina]QHQ34929.1 helix-turn-helix domain-containing protein [Algicella marina]